MATLSATNLTIGDITKRSDPNGKPARIAELLNQTNEVLTDAVFKEGNLPFGDQVTVRTSFPGVSNRLVNQGVAPGKSTTAQIVESCAIFETRNEIDVDAVKGDPGAFRTSEDMAFREAMNQAMTTALFYGNTAVNAASFTGLAPRYSSLSAPNAQNILDAGGTTGNLTSIYLVCWGDEFVYCPFPMGSMAGLLHEDLGIQTVHTDAGSAGTGTLKMQAYVSRWQWKAGLAIKDWRCAGRIANINIPDLLGVTGTQALTASTSILRLMLRLLYRIPFRNAGKCAFYLNRTAHSGLAIAAMDKAQNVLAVQQGMTQFGRPDTWLTFLGYPIRQVDAIVNNEARIV
jgi:hypothetical protein